MERCKTAKTSGPVNSEMTVIEVTGLTKDYRVRKKNAGKTSWLGRARNTVSSETEHLRTLNEVNFEMDAGEFTGYIGPNGSGKSTTIKLLTGVLTPTAGEAKVLGYTPWKERKQYTRNIGVIFA